jgi:hypothetical protein
MVIAAIVCAVLGLVLLGVAVAWLLGAFGSAPAGDWRERSADTAADFRDWLRTGR